MRRAAPAIALFFLSPLVAEFLLGDFTFVYLPVLVLLAPMYGGGALVIRELVRRTGRGWPSIVLLALAYAVLEEGLTTQSLFDPDYAGAHLLDQGYVPALGIAVPWTIFVLALHTVWSISVPVALVEEWSSRRTVPWLRRRGLVIACLLFALGIFGTTMSSYGNDHYLASWSKLLTVVIIVAALVVAAFRLPRRAGAGGAALAGGAPGAAAPSPWLVVAAMLVAGVVFYAAKILPVWPGVAAMVVALAGAASVIAIWSRRRGWGGMHRFAAAVGGLLTYAWHSFTTQPLAGGSAVLTPISHVVFAAAALALVYAEARALRRRADGRGGIESGASGPGVTGTAETGVAAAGPTETAGTGATGIETAGTEASGIETAGTGASGTGIAGSGSAGTSFTATGEASEAGAATTDSVSAGTTSASEPRTDAKATATRVEQARN